MNITQSDIDRFWEKIIFPNHHINECWEINTWKDKDGYGRFSLNNKQIRTHRFSYIIHNNFQPIPEEMFVCHTCDNSGCVNPNHLWLGTNRDNINDMMFKNRQTIGSTNGNSYLNEDLIIEMLYKIQNSDFSNMDEIANYYNTTIQTIHYILNGTTWKHITCHFPIIDLKNKLIRKTLKDNDVIEMLTKIWSDEFKDAQEIADYYGVSIVTIRDILLGKTWKQITDKLTIPLYQIKNKIIKKDKKGINNGSSKLTEPKIIQIKILLKDGISKTIIAKDFNVSTTTINNIKNNKTWKHIQI